MKTSKFALFAIGCTTAHVVLAQSSVTLYGVIDEGVAYVNNAQTMSNGVRTGRAQYSMVSAVRQGNRWGFRGGEDLGGGYKALFVMESGFNLGTGTFLQGGTMFGRQAYVGVDTPYGTLTLGRQYDSVVDFISPLTAPAGTGLYSVQGNDINNFGFTYRVNNAIKYTSKTLYGFTFSGLYSPGGVAGSFGRNSIYSFGGSYANGPVTIAAALLNVRDPNRSFWGNNQNSSPTDNNLGPTGGGVQVNPVYGGFASARNYQVIGAAAQYGTSSFIVGVNYSNVGFRNLNDPSSGTLTLTNPKGYSGNAVFNSYGAYARYAITPAFWLNGGYSYIVGGAVSGKDSAEYNLFNLGFDYLLSKRTDVYGVATYALASGTDSTGQRAVASVLAVTPSNTSRQVILVTGIRHLF